MAAVARSLAAARTSSRWNRRMLSTSPCSLYRSMVESETLRKDDRQKKAIVQLQRLHERLDGYRVLKKATRQTSSLKLTVWERISWIFRKGGIPKGVYIHGGVGIGKTMMMDLFYQSSPVEKKRRVHFHEFMLDVHRRIKGVNVKQMGDPIPVVAKSIADEAWLLCFDEFQVTDPADALLMQRLFQTIFDYGCVVVATSNRGPVDLYKGGINRSFFLPFIDQLQERCAVIHIDSLVDYRTQTEMMEGIYISPLEVERDGGLPKSFLAATSGEKGHFRSVPVMMGRKLDVCHAHQRVALFEFMDLCGKPLGAADYIAICDNFDIVCIDRIPSLVADRFNEMRRFITLIDVLYENFVYVYFHAEVPFDVLFEEVDVSLFDFEESDDFGSSDQSPKDIPNKVKSKEDQQNRTMRNDRKQLNSQKDEAVSVSGEGGSSGRSTTMIGKMEWSATGRVGVSLAGLSSIQDIDFARQRTISRMTEMASHQYRKVCEEKRGISLQKSPSNSQAKY